MVGSMARYRWSRREWVLRYDGQELSSAPCRIEGAAVPCQ